MWWVYIRPRPSAAALFHACFDLTHFEQGDPRLHLRADEQEQEFEYDFAAEDSQTTTVCKYQKPGPPTERQAGKTGGQANWKDLAESRVLGLWILIVLWRPANYGRGAGVNREHSSKSQRTGY